MIGSDTRRLLQAIKLTWIIFIGVAGVHLYVQHRMLEKLISNLLEVNAINHAALMTAESRASKAEILADIAVLKERVQTIHDIVAPGKRVPLTTAPTQADAVVTPKEAGRDRGGRGGKQRQY